jgi:hypothetical protein
MGNRANVIFTNKKLTNFSPCIYLHWNGGPESIYNFLEELNRRDVRADQCYEAARFTQLVGEFIDSSGQGGHSLGLGGKPKSATPTALLQACGDPSDNGLYLVCREGDDMKVDRYLLNYKTNKLEKQTDDWVDKEFGEAFENIKYRENLRKAFAKIAQKEKATA